MLDTFFAGVAILDDTMLKRALNSVFPPCQQDGLDKQLCHDMWPELSSLNHSRESDYYQLSRRAKAFQSAVKSELESLSSNVTFDATAGALLTQSILGMNVKQASVLIANKIGIPSSLVTAKHLLEILRILTSVSLSLDVHLAPIDSARSSANIPLYWASESSLHETIQKAFKPDTRESRQKNTGVLAALLTLANLNRLHHVAVSWTSHINHHLEYDAENKVLSVYEHKLWLDAQLRSQKRHTIPSEVLGECLDTLNLLCPHNDSRTASFLKREERSFHRLGNCGRPLRQDLQDYPVWGHRLAELQAIIDGPRSGVWQLLPRTDHGNLLESGNFWLAVSVFFLTIVSIVFGALSIVYAKEALEISRVSLDLTREQYLLSLAQACSDPASPPDVLQFC